MSTLSLSRMVEMQSACLKQAGAVRHLQEACDFSRVRLHGIREDIRKVARYFAEHGEIPDISEQDHETDDLEDITPDDD